MVGIKMPHFWLSIPQEIQIILKMDTFSNIYFLYNIIFICLFLFKITIY